MTSRSKRGCEVPGRAAPPEIGLDDIDAHVGRRLRLRRTMLGLSQQALGERLQVSFQQIQKYERGANGLGAGRLWQLSYALDAPVSFFFDDMPDLPGGTVPITGSTSSAVSRREMMDVVHLYGQIADPKLRRSMLDLLKAAGAAFCRLSG